MDLWSEIELAMLIKIKIKEFIDIKKTMITYNHGADKH